MKTFNSRVVLCRIRLFPTLISKIKWLGSGLPLTPEIAECYGFEFSKIEIKAQQIQLKNLTQSIVNRLEQTSPLEIKLEESNLG